MITPLRIQPTNAAPGRLSHADCEARLRAYMEKYGHEGTATRAEKEEAFRRDYWQQPGEEVFHL